MVVRLRDEGMTLVTIDAELKKLGRSVGPARLSTWLRRRDRERMRRQWEDRIINALRENNERMANVAKASGDTGMAAVMVGLEKVALQLSIMLSGDSAGIKFDGANLEEVREQLQIIAATIRPILEYRKVLVAERAGEDNRRRLENDTCEKFLAWYTDFNARQIAECSLAKEEKIKLLRQRFFADVDAAEREIGARIPGATPPA
jgi:hypothetical protein